MITESKKTEFEESYHRFDQCGIVMYLDSGNWLKGSVKYENDIYQHLGSVATNNGFSDSETTAIDASIKSMWYRLSRREDDYCIKCSADRITFNQMRICHMYRGMGKIQSRKWKNCSKKKPPEQGIPSEQ